MVYKRQGVKLYKNRNNADGDTEWDDVSNSHGSAEDPNNGGELMIGRLFNKLNGKYAKCEVDELLIWNKELYEHEITKIYESC